MSTEYVFLNPVRRGMAAYITSYAAQGAARASIGVKTKVARKPNGKDVAATEVKHIEVYGPGDVIGFESQIVTRTEPRHELAVMDFEPNYFPFIEFGEPDFAWRFSPEHAQGSARSLAPWITLIVLEQGEFTERGSTKDQQSYITVHPTDFEAGTAPGDNEIGGRWLPLPDLDHATKWAHVQVVAGDQDSPLFDHAKLQLENRAEVARILRDEPQRTVCRLLCPRRLRPSRRYTAFVVPTYASGVAAGLQRPAHVGQAHDRAWDVSSQVEIDLPYYFKWEFGTGLRGDFEYAIRQLKFRRLENIGKRPVDGSTPGYALPGVSDRVIQVEGALQSREFEEHAVDEDFERALARLLNREQSVVSANSFFQNVTVAFDEWGHAARLRWNTPIRVKCRAEVRNHSIPTDKSASHVVEIVGLEPAGDYVVTIETVGLPNEQAVTVTFEAPVAPLVLPPLYGRWHAGQRWLETTERKDRRWFETLNLDPRYRVAAGLGVALVAKHQQALMASAWDQLGEIILANDIVRRSQAGHAFSSAYHERILLMAASSDAEAAFVTAPLHARTRLTRCDSGAALVASGETELTTHLHFNRRTRVPRALFDRAFHRIASPRGPLRRRQKNAGQSSTLLDRFDADPARRLTPSEVARPELSHTAAAIESKPRGTTFLDMIAPNVLAKLDPELGTQQPEELEPRPTATPEEVITALNCALDPTHTFCDQVTARVDLSGLPGADERRCLDRIMAYPKFPQPLYAALAELSQEYIAPGLVEIGLNTVGLLQTNRRFVEAFFAGFNHAFGAELLWREFPTDQRGSYARQFWDPVDFLIPDLSDVERVAKRQRERWQERRRDIQRLHEWQNRLGDHAVPLEALERPLDEKVVLVIRGDLLKKHPETRIYAVKAVSDDGKIVPDLAEFLTKSQGSEPAISPVFTGHLAPDITFLGFPIDADEARGSRASSNDLGYFFVFEGRPMATRFGLDEPVASDDGSVDAPSGSGEADDVCAPASDDNLSWDSVETRAYYINPVDVDDPEMTSWETASPAVVARKTFQKAFRMSVHANWLLGEEKL